METRDNNSLSRLGKLANEGLTEDTTGAILRHIENFTDYTDDTLKKISASGGNPDRLLSKIDEYGRDFVEDLTSDQLKRVDDMLEDGITPEQFEALIQHADNIDNYTDEVLDVWKAYTGSPEDFLKLTDEFGEEFVEAFRQNGDEAVEEFLKKSEGGSELRNGYKFGELSVDSEEIQSKALQAAGEKAEEVSKLDSSRFSKVNDANSFLASVPDDATRVAWEPSASIPDGTDKFVWTDNDGNKWFAECHGPDSSAVQGSNAQTGWVYRISVKINGSGKAFYMATDGKFYSEKMFNTNSIYYVESIINDTHIPIN